MSKQLLRIDMDEAKRKVMGLSGCRRCLFLTEFEAQLDVEGRLSEKKGADRVVAAMQEDGINTDSTDYNLDTLTRYQ
jgi:hypothetical protein